MPLPHDLAQIINTVCKRGIKDCKEALTAKQVFLTILFH
jgi:hypothetical protein